MCSCSSHRGKGCGSLTVSHSSVSNPPALKPSEQPPFLQQKPACPLALSLRIFILSWPVNVVALVHQLSTLHSAGMSCLKSSPSCSIYRYCLILLLFRVLLQPSRFYIRSIRNKETIFYQPSDVLYCRGYSK